MAKTETNQELRERVASLETRNRHLTNELSVTRSEYETTAENYYAIYANMNRKIEERAADILSANVRLREEIERREKVQRELDRYREYLEEVVNQRTAALRESESKLKSVLENTPDIITIFDRSGRVNYVNRGIGAFSRETIPGMTVERLWPENAETFLKAFRSVLEKETMTVLEHADSSRRSHISRFLPLKDRGDVTAALVITTDITERVRAEKLREDMERITRHDLKTPINGIVALAEILLQEEGLNDEQRDMLRLLRRSASDLMNMLSLSLDLYKMENNTYTPALAPMDLAALTRRITDDLRKTIDRKGLRVEMTLDGNPLAPDAEVTILGEAYLCYSLFANLIRNAVEASPPDSPISIAARFDAVGHALIDIHNYGAVPAEIRDRFFERYVTSGKSWGLGLGTYSARLIARSQGGDITMKTSDEEGTTLSVRLHGRRHAAAAIS